MFSLSSSSSQKKARAQDVFTLFPIWGICFTLCKLQIVSSNRKNPKAATENIIVFQTPN